MTQFTKVIPIIWLCFNKLNERYKQIVPNGTNDYLRECVRKTFKLLDSTSTDKRDDIQTQHSILSTNSYQLTLVAFQPMFVNSGRVDQAFISTIRLSNRSFYRLVKFKLQSRSQLSFNYKIHIWRNTELKSFFIQSTTFRYFRQWIHIIDWI